MWWENVALQSREPLDEEHVRTRGLHSYQSEMLFDREREHHLEPLMLLHRLLVGILPAIGGRRDEL